MTTLFTERTQRSGLRDYFTAFVIAVILATFARTFVVQAFKVPSHSMEPGLRAGDHILVNKFIYGNVRLGRESRSRFLPARQMHRGDVVVFSAPTEPWRKLVKRCMGLSGDFISLDGTGLAIDGRQIDERSYVFDCREVQNCDPVGQELSTAIPEGHIIFLGDRRGRSNDSRSWGTVPRRLVIGRPVVIYWSNPDPVVERVDSWDKIGRVWWILKSRWERSLTIVR